MTGRLKPLFVVLCFSISAIVVFFLFRDRLLSHRSFEVTDALPSEIAETANESITGLPRGKGPHELLKREAIRQRVLEIQRRLSRSPIEPDPNFFAAEQADAMVYSAEQRFDIDRLYKIGVDTDNPDSLSSLSELVQKYPLSNRGSCAAMNLAARYLDLGETERATFLLNSLIEEETTGVFASGEKVLPKALFRLGLLKQAQGQENEADVLFDRVETSFAEDDDSFGVPYGQLIDEVVYDIE